MTEECVALPMFACCPCDFIGSMGWNLSSTTWSLVCVLWPCGLSIMLASMTRRDYAGAMA